MQFQNFNEIIKFFKEPYKLNIYNKKNYLLIKKILLKIEENKDYLQEFLTQENKMWSRNYTIDRITKIIDKYRNIEIHKNDKFGIGNIIAITTGDPYLHLELILNAILANCKIMLIANATLSDFNLYITSIVREVLKEEELEENLVSFVKSIDYKVQITKNQNAIDCIIVNKNYEDFNFFKENLFLKVIYLDYGSINVYIDSDEYEITIDKIVDECEQVDLDVYDYKLNNLKDFFEKEKNNFIYNTAVIFSKDIKKCMELYEMIKARNIFINTFDINKIDIGLDINDFLFEKKIVIEDGK